MLVKKPIIHVKAVATKAQMTPMISAIAETTINLGVAVKSPRSFMVRQDPLS
jgi:hypothetical protein